ncbi:MAG TPA: GNAT family N-acetyltransferase [Chitinophagaceae bacterium]|nr:GNAT family N-acetyltransferase [Chitinophagaceae bacterium]
MKNEVIIRDITESDDLKMASIIRACLEEFGAAKPGTVYYDATTDCLHTLFQKERSRYFVITIDGEVVAGGGIYPTAGLPDDTCELVKMYVSKEARGKGLATRLLRSCIDEAKKNGYKKMYLETMPELTHAIALYKKNGFTFIPAQLGCSGHGGCDLFMMKEI